MKSRSFLASAAGLLGLLWGSALSGVPAKPYSPGKHSKGRYRPAKYAKRDLSRRTHRDGCKALRKGIPGVPRGHSDSGIGVNGIRGAHGGGRDPGGATVTLCKRKQRREWWRR